MDKFIFMSLKACNSQPIRKAMFFFFLSGAVYSKGGFIKVPCKWKHALLKGHFCDWCGFPIAVPCAVGVYGWGSSVLRWQGLVPWKAHTSHTPSPSTPCTAVLKAPSHPTREKTKLHSLSPALVGKGKLNTGQGWGMQRGQKTSLSISPSCQVIC